MYMHKSQVVLQNSLSHATANKMDEFKSPLITVVIPNHNNSGFLIDCLESVLNQTYTNKEIILVDDGSTDKSLQVLLSYQDKIKLIATRNRGAAAARNTGILNAKGEFIAFLDSDDIWESDKLELQMDMILSGNYDLIYTSGIDFYTSGELGEISRPRYSGNCYKYFRKFPATEIIILGCNSALLRAELIKESGLFDESFQGAAEDWDFFRRYCRKARVAFSQNVLVKHRKHEGSIMTRPTLDWYLGNSKAIIKMFNDDPDIGFFERRSTWTKFQYSALKTFIKRRELKSAAKVLFREFFYIKLL